MDRKRTLVLPGNNRPGTNIGGGEEHDTKRLEDSDPDGCDLLDSDNSSPKLIIVANLPAGEGRGGCFYCIVWRERKRDEKEGGGNSVGSAQRRVGGAHDHRDSIPNTFRLYTYTQKVEQPTAQRRTTFLKTLP